MIRELTQVLHAERKSSLADAKVLYKVKALYAFAANRDDDLALDVDDIVGVIRDEGDWVYGVHEGNQKRGYFPRNYVDTLADVLSPGNNSIYGGRLAR